MGFLFSFRRFCFMGEALKVVCKEFFKAGIDQAFLISVDPGGKKTGWARWYRGKLLDYGHCAGEKLFESMPIDDLAGRVFFILEKPMFFGGREEVSSRIGALYRTAGIILGRALGLGWTCAELTPVEWKGQLPKKVTARKVSRIFPQVVDSTPDELDAIALGSRVLRYW
jgi:hypothetical protein